jgi:NAD(P)H-dependent flavin oxidoreductase YrpB (nitropropane dioxygenase family)
MAVGTAGAIARGLEDLRVPVLQAPMLRVSSLSLARACCAAGAIETAIHDDGGDRHTIFRQLFDSETATYTYLLTARRPVLARDAYPASRTSAATSSSR